MAEPTTTSTAAGGLLGLFVVFFGPMAGEWALIVFAALAGSMWAVGRSTVGSRLAATWLLLKLVTAAIVFTGLAVEIIQTQLGWPATQALAPVAFIIGFIGDRWQEILKATFDAFWNRIVRGKDAP